LVLVEAFDDAIADQGNGYSSHAQGNDFLVRRNIVVDVLDHHGVAFT
jgi:hypothetical protein